MNEYVSGQGNAVWRSNLAQANQLIPNTESGSKVKMNAKVKTNRLSHYIWASI